MTTKIVFSGQVETRSKKYFFSNSSRNFKMAAR